METQYNQKLINQLRKKKDRQWMGAYEGESEM